MHPGREAAVQKVWQSRLLRVESGSCGELNWWSGGQLRAAQRSGEWQQQQETCCWVSRPQMRSRSKQQQASLHTAAAPLQQRRTRPSRGGLSASCSHLRRRQSARSIAQWQRACRFCRRCPRSPIRPRLLTTCTAGSSDVRSCSFPLPTPRPLPSCRTFHVVFLLAAGTGHARSTIFRSRFHRPLSLRLAEMS